MILINISFSGIDNSDYRLRNPVFGPPLIIPDRHLYFSHQVKTYTNDEHKLNTLLFMLIEIMTTFELQPCVAAFQAADDEYLKSSSKQDVDCYQWSYLPSPLHSTKTIVFYLSNPYKQEPADSSNRMLHIMAQMSGYNPNITRH